MKSFRAVWIVAFGVLVLGLASAALGMKEPVRPLPPPEEALGKLSVFGPFVIVQQGGTTWVQGHTDTTECPGDPNLGHGGEATGGPDGSETWCFEKGPLDTCGTNPPWNTKCFDHVDVRTLPSQVGINYWHVDSLWTWQRTYCGQYCLWCGSDGTWGAGPVECGTWVNPPGYGDMWNCYVELSLPDTFQVANGCTLYFDTRYDTECKYDYYYVDVWDGSAWQLVAMFNATSNNYSATPCGDSKVAPDYFTNTDVNNLVKCNWQQRTIDPNKPVFIKDVTGQLGTVTEGPKFRWRFESDGAWSDADGRGDTHGAAFVDNVWVYGDAGNAYIEDFEDGSWAVLVSRGWSKGTPEGVIDLWHIVHDPNPPYEVGASRTTCLLDSSFVFRGRPEMGYHKDAPWRNAWYYRLLSPSVPITNTGCVVHYDQYMCARSYTCDYTDTQVRFYDTDFNMWCPWVNIDGYITFGGCFFWNFDLEEDITPFYGPSCDSMQFAWELMDVSAPGDYCEGKHTNTDNIIDNVSIGFFDGTATIFRARVSDLLHDTFSTGLCAYNSLFDCDNPDSINHYWGNIIPLRKDRQLYVEITDKDSLASVELWGTDDGGVTWVSKPMVMQKPFNPNNVPLGGEYYQTLCPTDFGDTAWAKGTEVWYYVKAIDNGGRSEYWRSVSDPNHDDHTGSRLDYFSFSILPMYPDTGYAGKKILLVDGFGRWGSQWDPCLEEFNTVTGWERDLEDIYELTLIDAGYCYDKFDITGGGSSAHCHPWDYSDYDCVIWFTGPYFNNYLFDAAEQRAIRDYLGVGGKVVLIGDRIANNMAVVGEDSLNGDFLAGIIGCQYLDEMGSPFDVSTTAPGPYGYFKGVSSVTALGTPVSVNLDSIVIYRECPGRLRDMSYVRSNPSPPTNYTSQALLDMLNEDSGFSPAHGATYVEYKSVGQLVYINFCLSSMVNHQERYCTGVTPPQQVTDFKAGEYEGRVDLMYVVLNDLFGLPPNFPGGGGGTSDVEPKTIYRWALGQNMPNPCVSATEIRYEVARTSDVSVKVYNAMGQLVRTLVDERKVPGKYFIRWDGRNAAGARISSGVYFYKMEANQYTATKKMLVVQ
jgi:hypothetical protein